MIKKNRNTLKVLGILIRYNRINQNLSLRQLAKKTNISHTLISNIETGKIIPNEDTLNDIFNVLGLEYYYDTKLENRFYQMREKCIQHLIQMNYQNAKEVWEKIEIDADVYHNSSVVIDFSQLKYLYLTMTDETSKNYEDRINTINTVFEFFTDNQKQMTHFINGINHVTNYRFKDAIDSLEAATKIGNAKLDPIINVYRIIAYTKTYRFMDSVKLANQTINKLESILNYKRAMEIRISLGNAYYLVNKFEEAKEQFDKVNQFNEIYQTKTLHNLCHISYAKLYLKQGNVKRCLEYLAKTDTLDPHYHSTLITAYGKIGDTSKVKEVLDNAKQTQHYKNSNRYRLIADILSMKYHLIEVTDETFESALKELIKIGIDGHQQETLEVIYGWLIEFYQSKRLYKKALEACQTIYNFRRFGINGNK